ncbi:LOB domain-containing protein 29-like [Diospyros lotus]|uniref:LOB domain-containing protein 29-like n=1 Tax=Diospyros lotus TaxID=55363 RepID=UPI0022526A73|nr:LOB domain-containing protein 29-like [Diospyros lotus]
MPWGNIPRPWSRCGACVVLNRGCNSQCIFAPYFHCEDGIAHFVAIRDVFTVRNVVNILALLSVSDSFWASDTLLFEAQARLQDPIYGCVSHILALQQQDLLFAYYSLHPQPVPQLVQNPSWNYDLPIIPEDVPYPSFPEAALPPYPGEASSSQMPPPNDIDELGSVVFGNRHRY